MSSTPVCWHPSTAPGGGGKGKGWWRGERKGWVEIGRGGIGNEGARDGGAEALPWDPD